MKKLLIFLGAIGLSSSTLATTVACVDKNSNKIKIDNNEMKEFLGGIAKAIYLNDEYGYDAKYMIQELYLKNNESKKELFRKYFDKNIFAQELDPFGFQLKKGKQPSDKDNLLTLVKMIKQIGLLNESENKLTQVQELVVNLFSIFNNGNEELNLLKSDLLIKHLSETLKIFGDNLSLKNYYGKTWSYALNSAVIDLTNSLNSSLKMDLILDNKDLSEENLVQVLKNLTLGIRAFNKKDQPQSFANLLQDFDKSTGFINFFKVLIVYLINFISTQPIGEGILNQQAISNFQNKTISEQESKIDLKQVINQFKKYLTAPINNDYPSNALTNILNVLVVNQNKAYYQEKSLKTFKSIDGIFDKLNEVKIDPSKPILGLMLGAMIDGFVDISQTPLGVLFRGLKAGNIAANVLGMAATGVNILESNVWNQISGLLGILQLSKQSIDNIQKLLTSKTLVQIIWNENIIGEVMKDFMGGDLLELSGKGLIQKPLSELLGMQDLFGFDFIQNGENKMESIADIVDLVSKKIGENNVVLNLDKICELLHAISLILKSPKNTINDTIAQLDEKNLDLFLSLKGDFSGAISLAAFMKEELEKQKEVLTKEIEIRFNKIQRFASSSDDDFNYKYVILGKTIGFTLSEVDSSLKVTKIIVAN